MSPTPLCGADGPGSCRGADAVDSPGRVFAFSSKLDTLVMMGLQIYYHGGNTVANIPPLQRCWKYGNTVEVADILPQQGGHKEFATAMGSQTVLGLQNYSAAGIIGVTLGISTAMRLHFTYVDNIYFV